MADKRRPGRPTKAGPKVKNAGIALYPHEIELIDRLIVKFGLSSRSTVVRRLIKDHPETADAEKEAVAA